MLEKAVSNEGGSLVALPLGAQYVIGKGILKGSTEGHFGHFLSSERAASLFHSVYFSEIIFAPADPYSAAMRNI